MNTGLDKDKEAFDRHLDEMMGSGYTRRKFYGGEGSGTVAATRTAWKAALVYCRAESSNRDSEIIARLNQENEKLKEALRHYADFNDEVSMYDSRGISIARNTLREVAVDDICESKGW